MSTIFAEIGNRELNKPTSSFYKQKEPRRQTLTAQDHSAPKRELKSSISLLAAGNRKDRFGLSEW